MTAPDRDAIRGRVLAKRVIKALAPDTGAVEVFRAAVAAECPALHVAWVQSHAHIIGASHREGDCFVPMFRYAAFAIPAGLPDTLTVWRGTAGIPASVARTGRAWTTNRDAACRWATTVWRRWDGGAQKMFPMVVRREIPRHSVLFWYEADEMQPITEVVFDMPPAGEQDGDEADWLAAAARDQRAVRDRVEW